MRLTHQIFCVRMSNAWKLVQELCTAVLDSSSEFRSVIREIEKWTGRTKFLSLKQHGCTGHKQHQSSQCFIPAEGGQLMKPHSVGRICNLIVVLKVCDKGRGL